METRQYHLLYLRKQTRTRGDRCQSGDVQFRNDKTGNSTAVIPTPLIVVTDCITSSGYNTGNIAFDLSIEQDKLVAKQAFFKKSKESMSNDPRRLRGHR